MRYSLTFSCLFFTPVFVGRPPVVDLIIFSKNRPLQIYAFLESYEKYVTGTDHISVIYYAGKEYAPAYTAVRKRFAKVHYIRQDIKNPYADFKKLLCKAVSEHNATHIIFAVDDIVVIDYVDVVACAKALKKYKAYGFYLRLGRDIIECYAEGMSTGLPPFKMHTKNIFSWKFGEGAGDWNYPHTVDMTLFKKKDVAYAVKNLDYDSPNTFEQAWSGINIDKNERGLCFAISKIVNLPLNLVQNDFDNRHGAEYDVQFLLAKFQQGFKMDISALHKFPHKAPHAEYQPTFIAR